MREFAPDLVQDGTEPSPEGFAQLPPLVQELICAKYTTVAIDMWHSQKNLRKEADRFFEKGAGAADVLSQVRRCARQPPLTLHDSLCRELTLRGCSPPPACSFQKEVESQGKQYTRVHLYGKEHGSEGFITLIRQKLVGMFNEKYRPYENRMADVSDEDFGPAIESEEVM